MTIGEMHYDFKTKLNKVDSQQNRNLRVPEIDWALNEAQELFVKIVAHPRYRTLNGFEKSRRNLDDIRTIVIPDAELTYSVESNDEYKVVLPVDYWFYVRAYAKIEKEGCETRKARIEERQHDDLFEESVFDRSSYRWKKVNATYDKTGMRLYTNGDFSIKGVNMAYIKKLAYIHNAESFQGGEYKLSPGVTLTGSVDCELPETVHREIVDLGVLIVSGNLQIPGYEIKFNKLKFNNLN